MKSASLAVPTRSRDGKDQSEHLKQIQDLLLEKFGGFTVGHAKGQWRDGDGKSIVDDLIVFEVAFFDQHADMVTECAKHIGNLLNEPLFARIDNEAYEFADDNVSPGTSLPPPIEGVPVSWPSVFDVAIQTVIGVELQTIQDHFGVNPQSDVRSVQGSLFYRAMIRSTVCRSDISAVVYCQGAAGNDMSAMSAERLISRWNPKAIFLLGIAAGRRGNCKIGDVVTPRVVVDDTLGVAEASQRLKRPRIFPPPHAMIQQLQNYRLNIPKWHERLLTRMQSPKAPRGKAKDYRQLVATAPAHREAAIYSSNILLRDQNVLEAHAKETHQQIKIGEMEAAGFGIACEQRERPVPWLVVRGVSDFGDSFKDDLFHQWAAHAAASFLLLLMEDGIRIDLFKRGED